MFNDKFYNGLYNSVFPQLKIEAFILHSYSEGYMHLLKYKYFFHGKSTYNYSKLQQLLEVTYDTYTHKSCASPRVCVRARACVSACEHREFSITPHFQHLFLQGPKDF